jgi:hypothetical protein
MQFRLPLSKNLGGSSLGSLCGGSSCYLYSTGERGEGGVDRFFLLVLSCLMRSLMYCWFLINGNYSLFKKKNIKIYILLYSKS